METSVVVCHMGQAVPSYGEMPFFREAGAAPRLRFVGNFDSAVVTAILLFSMLAPWQQRQVSEMLVSVLEARQAKVLDFGSNLV